MKRIATIAFVLLAGCTQIGGAKEGARVITDKAMDKAYGATCNMRYKTEQRFRVRNGIESTTMALWCGRLTK